MLDIMLDGRFVCQLRYHGQPFPKIINGKVCATYDSRDIVKFVHEKKPSLDGKPIEIAFTNQRVMI
ncbi:MAG: hypothetical protein IJR71_01560 [Prevotella sp.]|nr:hypothetical protein [Prevotella sp.]